MVSTTIMLTVSIYGYVLRRLLDYTMKPTRFQIGQGLFDKCAPLEIHFIELHDIGTALRFCPLETAARELQKSDNNLAAINTIPEHNTTGEHVRQFGKQLSDVLVGHVKGSETVKSPNATEHRRRDCARSTQCADNAHTTSLVTPCQSQQVGGRWRGCLRTIDSR